MGDAKLAKAPMTLDAPAMTKASASRNIENLRGIEAVVSVDRVSSSEGAEGPDILTAALRLVGSGADDTPPSAPRNSKLCQVWVIRDRTSLSYPSLDVRFPPKATETLLCSEMTRWATSGHFSAGHLTKRWRPMTVKRAIAATA
jgi:hypothetical protein